MAGTAPRRGDPAADARMVASLLASPVYRHEHEVTIDMVHDTLLAFCSYLDDEAEPSVVPLANVQHLATPIRAQLSQPVACVELAGLLHPTPAVGGEPSAKALPLIPALEGLDRGWYAGPVGWTDLAEDGEFCVALRCALLRGSVAHLYAGEGIVRDSVPSEELAANEAKLQALLPLLT